MFSRLQSHTPTIISASLIQKPWAHLPSSFYLPAMKTSNLSQHSCELLKASCTLDSEVCDSWEGPEKNTSSASLPLGPLGKVSAALIQFDASSKSTSGTVNNSKKCKPQLKVLAGSTHTLPHYSKQLENMETHRKRICGKIWILEKPFENRSLNQG